MLYRTTHLQFNNQNYPTIEQWDLSWDETSNSIMNKKLILDPSVWPPGFVHLRSHWVKLNQIRTNYVGANSRLHSGTRPYLKVAIIVVLQPNGEFFGVYQPSKKIYRRLRRAILFNIQCNHLDRNAKTEGSGRL